MEKEDVEEFQEERLHSKASSVEEVEEEGEEEEFEEEEVEDETESARRRDADESDDSDESVPPLVVSSSPGSASNENVAEYLAVAFLVEEEAGLGAGAAAVPPFSTSSAFSAFTSFACLGSRTPQLSEVALRPGSESSLCSLPAASLARTENTQVPVPRPP